MAKRYLLDSNEQDYLNLEQDVCSFFKRNNLNCLISYELKHAFHELYEIENKGAIHYVFAKEGNKIKMDSEEKEIFFISCLTFAGFDKKSKLFQDLQLDVENVLQQYIINKK